MDQTNLLALVAAALVFVMILCLGLVIAGAGGGSSQAKTVKRAQALVSTTGDRQAKLDRAKMARQANNGPEARRKQILKTLKEQEAQQRKQTLTIDAKLRQAGLSLTLRGFWIISVSLALTAALVALIFRIHPLVVLGIAMIFGLGVPRWVVGSLGKRRLKKFTASFSDAIDIIVRGIKSGLPVHDCLKIIGRESPEPLGSEFIRLVENMGMGMAIDQALEQMYGRMPTPELRFFTIVMNIQQKTGGNLAEALGNLSAVLRGRTLMREKIKALSSEAVASAFIIGSLPPTVVGLVSFTSPSYMRVLYQDPRGQLILIVGCLVMAMGIFVMRKMINFKF